jgi:hypothetical protein
METIPERIDWLWFLDFDLDSEIPTHSVLSKARKKWGSEVFKSFFERIFIQCVEAGLVEGSKIFIDSSLIDANASNKSVLDTKSLKHQLHENYHMLEARRSSKSRRDLRTRQHLMERSFAWSKRYGYDQARWRELWRMRIQEYLVCAIQNIQVLVKYGAMPKKPVAMALNQVKKRLQKQQTWLLLQ